MRKTLLSILTASAVLFSSAGVLARDVGEDMETIAKHYSVVLKTDDAAKMKDALQQMRVAAVDAHRGTPPKLEKQDHDSPDMKDYRHGMDLLIGQIDGALKLVDEGKITEARAAAEEFKTTRNTYHKKYR
ncbi:cytochrome b562 [Shimwellia blattae]|uniref:Soluble cytochrome b562 n=1 Tax=Shimwellia blattae (strain ATCC 29907 / DSM 4481 / JCM 1650 / NBRC 105725 / CDC 9005-74) TaxID=630626 RepID=I2BDI3_SHIBC|nr:cytochrome b562 [Shimwellia blattae]AFJ48587.1 putative cytochrome b562 [Shimwellia blattae DSM 4481 = NBRC 105725]GAB81378.1 putative cytochrome [Shimwellia blattae DSM 4481 = NBRC 105725]VDY66077.1 Soluble cytochrome b562 precursor [Shimwellia blattae]VEC26872.1 Soluble cytochrome b562 precursor [Shimwellia blattae]